MMQLDQILIFLTPLLLIYLGATLSTVLVRWLLIGIGTLYQLALVVRLALELDCSFSASHGPHGCAIMPDAFWEALNLPTVFFQTIFPLVAISASVIGLLTDRFFRQRRKGEA